PYIDFDATPFRVQRDVAPWNRPVADVEGTRTELPRVAALSSFGAGGSNAHLVIQEHPKEDRPVGPAGGSGPEPVAVVLSAKSEAELRRSAELLVEELRGGRHTAADLPGIARTLQVGREAMACRLAFLTTGLDHAADTLAAYLEGTVGDSVVTGRAHGDAGPDSADPAEVERWLTEGRLSSLLRCWVEGTEIDWSRLSTAAGIPGRVSLPTYPFAEESHWLPSPVRRATRTPGHGPWLHPLVHSNTSDLSCQRFTSTFPDGDPAPSSPFLRMEMARAALLLAIASAEADAARVCLSDVAWSAPIASGGERTIRIDLGALARGGVEWSIYVPGPEGGAEGAPLLEGAATVLPADAPDPDALAALREACVHPVGGTGRLWADTELGSGDGGEVRLLVETGTGERDDHVGVANARVMAAAFESVLEAVREAVPADATPLRAREVVFGPAEARPAWGTAVVRPRSDSAVAFLDLALLATDGTVIVCVRGLECGTDGHLRDAAEPPTGTASAGPARTAESPTWPLARSVTGELREIVGQLLKLPMERLDDGVSFEEYGFQSITLAEFAGVLSERFDVEVTPGVFYSSPTLRDLTEHLMERHGAALATRYGQGGDGAQTAPLETEGPR